MINLRGKLDEMARSLLLAAASASQEEQLDVFKQVSTYYLGCHRIEKTAVPPEDSIKAGKSFKDLQRRVTEGHA